MFCVTLKRLFKHLKRYRGKHMQCQTNPTINFSVIARLINDITWKKIVGLLFRTKRFSINTGKHQVY